jgi:hydrogenase maturation protease
MSQKHPHILILGLGNILLSDEGFGVHVVQELEQHYLFPPRVTLYDGGTGGLSLLSQFQAQDFVLIIDALLLGAEPGTVARFTLDAIPDHYQRKDTAHGIDILDVVAASSMIGHLPPIMVLGAQPKDMVTPATELSPELIQAKESVIQEVMAILKEKGIHVRPRGKSSS